MIYGVCQFTQGMEKMMEYKIIADGACDLYGENADKISDCTVLCCV